MEQFFEVLDAVRDNENLNPKTQLLVHHLINAFQNSIPYAQVMDVARIKLFPDILNYVRDGNVVGFNTLRDEVESGDYMSHPVERRIYQEVQNLVIPKINKLSKERAIHLSTLAPQQVFILPSGTVFHEVKIVFIRQEDGSFHVYKIDTQNDGNGNVQVEGWRNVKVEQLTPSLLASIMLIKMNIGESFIIPGEEIIFPKESWAPKRPKSPILVLYNPFWGLFE